MVAVKRKFEAELTFDVMKKHLPAILKEMPEHWRGTTFKNSHLLGRDGFEKKVTELLLRKEHDGSKITMADLEDLGNAEDYFRVSSNISTTLEIALALEKHIKVNQVFTFASAVMPILAVCLTVGKLKPVHLYASKNPFSDEQLKILKLINVDLIVHTEKKMAKHPKGVVLAEQSVADAAGNAGIDGVIGDNVLFILNTTAIEQADILVIRKRLATPVTTPKAEAMLQAIAGVPVTANKKKATAKDINTFLSHLQELCGTAANDKAQPVCFTAGLPAICSFWMALLAKGGADIVMCSTAYGGSSQLTDILTTGEMKRLKKHTFDIQGTIPIKEAIESKLNAMAKDAKALMPITCLFVEVPTNPDMKVPDMNALATMLVQYQKKTGKEVVLLVDTTFAPGSKVMEQMKKQAPDCNVMVFVSMSKSVSRGMTCAGAIIANHTAFSAEVLKHVAASADMLDTRAKQDQMHFLVENHVGVESRCLTAYQLAVQCGDSLVKDVKAATKQDMSLAFVTPAQAKLGFTTSTFSFNLPPPKNATTAINAALAQRFVDLLTVHDKIFKPCVSFGQDNKLCYITVPATSTQGAIKEEDKAKQAVGGVQLVRMSFPPTIDIKALNSHVSAAVKAIYN